ncbi:MAG: HAD-IIB family hydrolase [Candidatus Micrarchaeota archaeon]|nr:HAD-IIB family hydrolase [Candidatus Micrarchaeota archaeon]
MATGNTRKIKLIVADLDGTISISKQHIDKEMSNLLGELLKYKDFALISGGSYNQFRNQFLDGLKIGEDASRLSRLYLFPTCATSMYVTRNGSWKKLYGEKLPTNVKKEIYSALDKALAECNFKKPGTIYGELVEDRETQVTFSALGQLAPIELKQEWDPQRLKRKRILKHLAKHLPKGYVAKIGGTTSIDVTKKGIDKAYGIRKIMEKLGYGRSEILFIGDMLQKGGNDYPVKATRVRCMEVKNPEETKTIIRAIISESAGQK